ncbi:proline-rich protein 36-like [Amyelois transitella]|uniref:proline-rich protein 36-like n=1 Tax=Amyelois transitella TaxID=680683 RepID=UPI0029900EAF|nr:proline-rich protein 36-like [Amyelois transitella]
MTSPLRQHKGVGGDSRAQIKRIPDREGEFSLSPTTRPPTSGSHRGRGEGGCSPRGPTGCARQLPARASLGSEIEPQKSTEEGASSRRPSPHPAITCESATSRPDSPHEDYKTPEAETSEDHAVAFWAASKMGQRRRPRDDELSPKAGVERDYITLHSIIQCGLLSAAAQSWMALYFRLRDAEQSGSHPDVEDVGILKQACAGRVSEEVALVDPKPPAPLAPLAPLGQDNRRAAGSGTRAVEPPTAPPRSSAGDTTPPVAPPRSGIPLPQRSRDPRLRANRSPAPAPSLAAPACAPPRLAASASPAAPPTAPLNAPLAAPPAAPLNAPLTAPSAGPRTLPPTAPLTAPPTAPLTAPLGAPLNAPLTVPPAATRAAPPSAARAAPPTAPLTAPPAALCAAPPAAPSAWGQPRLVASSPATAPPAAPPRAESDNCTLCLGPLLRGCQYKRAQHRRHHSSTQHHRSSTRCRLFEEQWR